MWPLTSNLKPNSGRGIRVVLRSGSAWGTADGYRLLYQSYCYNTTLCTETEPSKRKQWAESSATSIPSERALLEASLFLLLIAIMCTSTNALLESKQRVLWLKIRALTLGHGLAYCRVSQPG